VRDADDLTQETFARAFASLHRFAGRSTARTWLLSIARRVCADAIRARKPVSPMSTVDITDAADVGAGSPRSDRLFGNSSADPADTVSLRLLLNGLDASYREAFVLTQILGLSYPEAADVAGCPIGTIRSRVFRARDALVRGMAESATDRRSTGSGS
jgi:RNA polymerase sigma-70 factor (ECF subfamily)